MGRGYGRWLLLLSLLHFAFPFTLRSGWVEVYPEGFSLSGGSNTRMMNEDEGVWLHGLDGWASVRCENDDGSFFVHSRLWQMRRVKRRHAGRLAD